MANAQSAFKQGVTANRLTDGAVVYLVSAGRWSELLRPGRHFKSV